MDADIRWRRRFANYKKAFGRLDEAVLLTREAFRMGLIRDGDVWMEMIRSRNQSSHTYNLEIAAEIVKAVEDRYWAAFRAFLGSMEARERQA